MPNDILMNCTMIQEIWQHHLTLTISRILIKEGPVGCKHRIQKISETSCFESQMHFDDSVESTADSDLEDGELQKMLTSPLYAQKALVKPDALFSSEQGNLTRSSVFINANPSNLRGSLLEGNKDHLPNQARSDLAKQELHVIGELQRQTEENRLALQDA